MHNALLINSIYMATEGEGVHIGTPQIFVRFQGCAIGCLNCDSKDTWEFSESHTMSMNEVLNTISLLSKDKLKRVSITGGDPLHPNHIPSVVELCKNLKERGYYINIEAAGTRLVHEVFDIIDFISFDFKTPSTGVRTNPKLIKKLIEQYPKRFQIKGVVETEKDIKAYYDCYNEVLSMTEGDMGTWCITPCYNLEEEFPLERFQNVLEWNQQMGGLFRVIGQQHKWIFGPDKKQV